MITRRLAALLSVALPDAPRLGGNRGNVGGSASCGDSKRICFQLRRQGNPRGFLPRGLHHIPRSGLSALGPWVLRGYSACLVLLFPKRLYSLSNVSTKLRVKFIHSFFDFLFSLGARPFNRLFIHFDFLLFFGFFFFIFGNIITSMNNIYI